MAGRRRVKVRAQDWFWIGEVIAAHGPYLWVQGERGGAPATVHQNDVEDPDRPDPRQEKLL